MRFFSDYGPENLIQTTMVHKREIFSGEIGYCIPDLPSELGFLNTPSKSPDQRSQSSSKQSRIVSSRASRQNHEQAKKLFTASKSVRSLKGNGSSNKNTAMQSSGDKITIPSSSNCKTKRIKKKAAVASGAAPLKIENFHSTVGGEKPMTWEASQTPKNALMENLDENSVDEPEGDNEMQVDYLGPSESDEMEAVFRTKPPSKRARRTKEMTS